MLQATRRTVLAPAPVEGMKADNVWALVSYAFLLVAVVMLVIIGVRASQILYSGATTQSVKIDGDISSADRQKIHSAIMNIGVGNYFTTDIQAIRQTITEMKWVEDAMVSRRWPQGVRVQVREIQPVALWGAGGLLSSRGQPYIPAKAIDTTGLPILSGPSDRAEKIMEQYRAMNSVLRGSGMHIVELQLTERMSWFLRLDNGIKLVVDQTDTISKLQKFAYLYEKQLRPDVARIASVDLRYRNGIAIGWK